MNSPFFYPRTEKKGKIPLKTRRKHKITGRERRLEQDEKIVGQKNGKNAGLSHFHLSDDGQNVVRLIVKMGVM